MKQLVCALLIAGLQVTGSAAQAHVLVISGLGGEPKYVDDFHNWGVAMVDAARDRLGVPAENVVLLTEDPERDPSRVNGSSRREEVEQAIADIARRAGPDDRVMVLMFGHGSADSRGARINLPGPDLTAVELAELLSAFPTQPIVVVNAASASGDFQEALAGPNRTIITATQSGMERNETLFGGFFVAAFAGEGADVNRDSRVTIAEAYEYATRETERTYEAEGRLQMEHARIEGDMELAGLFHLGGATSAAPTDAPPELRALYAERARLEESIEALRLRAAQLDPAEYERELEQLLLELARTNQRIREEEGGI